MIVYCCEDLLFATKIRSTADELGIGARPARNAEALGDRLNQIDDGKLSEPVMGVAVDLALGDVALTLIEQAKAHAAAPLVVAFGSHVATQLLESAAERGADFVLPRSAFTASLPQILDRLAQR